jgi:UDP:flavonoid glycosyltransferase YjiC (YdhE family)
MLINSRVAAHAATSVHANGATLDLTSLPDKSLEETTAEERQRVASLIGTMASWPWLGASVATKTLHKKRPALIPILDNQAIFGAYMNPLWPESVPWLTPSRAWLASTRRSTGSPKT